MSCLMHVMRMQNMCRYSVQRGSCQRASPEDSTDEPTTDWAGAGSQLEGPMDLMIK